MNDDNFRFPELFLTNLLKQEAREKFVEKSDNPSVFKRALVIAVDVVGGMLQNPAGIGKVDHRVDGKQVEINATKGPENPRNSIKARVLSDGFDQFFDDDSLKVYYPMSSHTSAPVKPGEHVLVLFEDSDYQNGWWFSKVPGHSGFNYTPGEKTFDKNNDNSLTNLFPDTAGQKKQEEDLETNNAASEAPPNGKLTKLF